MPIKSLFVPKYALQGEDIPAHITWENITYDQIRIQFFPYLSLKDVFNAKYEYDKNSHTIIIKEVEMEGYIGLLFGSNPIEDASYKGRLIFSFIGEGGIPICQETREIEMFRHKIVVKKLPKVMKIDPVKKFVYNRIPIINQGRGTALLNFLTSADSEIQKIIPNSVEEIRKKFRNDLNESFLKLKQEFRQYSELIDDLLAYLLADWKSYDDIKKAKILAQQFVEIFSEDEKFLKAFSIGFGEALYKNINIRTLPDRILGYLNSLAARKMLLVNPEDIVKVYKKSKILKLELMPTDLLLNEFTFIKLPPIEIVGTQEGEIEIFKLFEWEES